MTDTTTRLAEILEAAEARWARHAQVLEWERDARIRGPQDPFTAAQEFAHQWRWLDYALAAARADAEGGAAPPLLDDMDAQNEAWAAEDAALTFEDARDRCEAARSAYIAYVSERTAASPDEALLTSAYDNLVDHFDVHFAYIVAGSLAHEAAGWQRLTAILDARPSEVLHRGDDGHAWRAADIYAHLERWMTANIPRVDAFLATGAVPDLDAGVDDLNARWLSEDAAVTFEDARTRVSAARERFMAQMRSIPQPAWTARVLGLYHGNAWGHYQEHLSYMEG